MFPVSRIPEVKLNELKFISLLNTKRQPSSLTLTSERERFKEMKNTQINISYIDRISLLPEKNSWWTNQHEFLHLSRKKIKERCSTQGKLNLLEFFMSNLPIEVNWTDNLRI